MAKLWCALIFISSTFSLSAQQAKNLSKGTYVVVGAFSPSNESFAVRLSESMTKDGREADYGFEPTRKFWYVYLKQFSKINDCVVEAKKLRTEGTVADAWVHVIKEESAPAPEPEVAKQPTETAQPVAEVKKDTVAIEDVKPAAVVTEAIDNPPAAPVYEPQTLNNTQVFLSLYNATTNKVIDGDVDVVDTEKGKLITKVNGNSYITLPNPGTKSGQLSLVSNTFGYRKEQLEINYKNTEADTLKPYVTLVGNFYMINFGLSKIQKGDISTLFNVYFFNDAVLMLPESKYQLSSLLEMLNENPKMKIVLHGHTNGNGRGKIIYMGKSKDFFALSKDNDQGSGSSKALSEARAETIRQWLISQGITEDRISVKGWGGSRMMYDKGSSYARKNIRVDVEVAED
ncbi:MAG: OmpA family protein [Bacteroidetes bacterium]|nr:OmpA family protein [Bacteroidota bacterium]